MNSQELKVGHRFQVGRERGSVMHVGILPVVHPKHVWVGVDWDNQSRGKHDGTVKGVRYFQARTKTSGSFLKFQKFLPKCKSVESFLDAVKERYIKANLMFLEEGNEDILTLRDEDEEGEEEEDGKRRKKGVNIELVGMGEVAKKLADLSSLKKVSLPERFVQTIDPSLEKQLPNLTTIDLSHTLIYDLDLHVLSLVRQLKKLKSLNISENRLYIDSNLFNKQQPKPKETHTNLELLVMNRCWLSFEKVKFITSHFPALKELHICGNEFSDLDSNQEEEVEGEDEDEEEDQKMTTIPAITLPITLEVIHLANNNLSNIENVLHWNSGISNLPNLKTLNLNSNNFSIITPLFRFDPKSGIFSKLEHLALAKNKLQQITTSVEVLRDYPSLTSLVVFGNELDQTKELEAILDVSALDFMTIKEREKEKQAKIRLLIIGKMGGLENLNRSEVTVYERKDLERYYLKRFYYELKDDVRMKYLIAKYPGFVDPTMDPAILEAESKKQKVSIIPVMINFLGETTNLRNEEEEEVEEKNIKKKKKKKLKLSMTVNQLKVLCKRLFKIDQLERIRIFFVMKNEKKVSLDEDDAQLGGSFYGVNHDVKDLYVILIDLEGEKMMRERMQQEFDDSVKNQEEQIYKKLEWQKKNQYY